MTAPPALLTNAFGAKRYLLLVVCHLLRNPPKVVLTGGPRRAQSWRFLRTARACERSHEDDRRTAQPAHARGHRPHLAGGSEARRFLRQPDALGKRFRHAGGIADLDEAVEVARQAAWATPDISPTVRRLLGDALESRYGARGKSVDLDEAIEAIRLAVEPCRRDLEVYVVGHPQRPKAAAVLGNIMRAR